MTPIQRVKYAVKVSVAYLLYGLGVLWVWQRIALRRKAVVLMYHRVLTRDEQRVTGSHPGIIVTCDTFSRHMAFLKRRFAVLSLDEFADRMERRVPFPDSSCLITFDDGWKDNATNAMPVLQRFGLPAVVFLPVNYIGAKRLFWQEALVHLTVTAIMAVRADATRARRLSELLARVRLDSILDLPDPDPRSAVIQAIMRSKGTPPPVMESTLREIGEELGVALDGLVGTDGFMRWDEIENMSRNGIAFGGHGVEHRLLTYVSHDEAKVEICVSKETLGRRFEKTVPAFSYPNGYFTSDIVDLVKGAGYRLAFITSRGFVTSEDDRYTIRRLNIHESVTNNIPMFWARVVGLF